MIETQQALKTKGSPMDELNEQFINHNKQLEELIQRLRSRLHRLSDTNFPKEENVNKTEAAELPFHEGQLMNYHQQLNRNYRLIMELTEEVIKAESLI